MFRRFVIVILTFVVFFPLIERGTVLADAGRTWLNDSHLDQGVIGIRYNVKANVKTKLLIAKGTSKYTYNLIAGRQEERFPLQMGNGEYSISVLEQKSGTKYQVMAEASIRLELLDSSKVFLNSTQNVNWNPSSAAVLKAQALTKNMTSDQQKVKAIYNYVINNIKYDKKLALNVSADYIPQIDWTLSARKDTCYGYSALFAAMLRSVNIPTKLDMGMTSYVNTYHAWNEVYLDHSWVVIDTTVDAGWKGTTTSFQMIKDSSKYKADKNY